jgi:4-hydroxybenzoate polyprenyltransferase
VTGGVDGQVLRGTSRLVAYTNFVKVAHTVFSLPFAVVGIAAASLVAPLRWSTVALTVVAFSSARFAAMGFNRIADRRLDAANPRTAARELPSGRMTTGEAWALVVAAAVTFIVVAGLINRLCLILSPVALVWILAYSYTKRYTALCHVWLGVAMAIAPVGGYLAVTGSWSTPWWLLVVLAAAVASWGSGFDVLYSLQDEGFDRQLGLKSTAVALGARGAIRVARMLHLLAATSLMIFGLGAGLGLAYQASVLLASGLLVWEHRLVKPNDYSRLDAAFFTMNGVISGLVMLGALVDVLARHAT